MRLKWERDRLGRSSRRPADWLGCMVNTLQSAVACPQNVFGETPKTVGETPELSKTIESFRLAKYAIEWGAGAHPYASQRQCHAFHTWPGLVAIPAIALRESTMHSAHSASWR